MEKEIFERTFAAECERTGIAELARKHGFADKLEGLMISMADSYSLKQATTMEPKNREYYDKLRDKMKFNHPFEEFRSRALDAINDLSKKYERDLEKFSRETEKYHSGEAYKQLKEEHDKLRRKMELGFPVSEEERASIKNWIDDGNRRSHEFEYRFSHTAIGTVGKIVDIDTGEEFDFTDYAMW